MIFRVSEKSTPPLSVNLPFPFLTLFKIDGSHIHFLDAPKEISNKEILDDCLPFAKASIHETSTLVAVTRIKSDQISIPTNRSYAFSKQYGENAELKITFPAGVTKEKLNLTVQVMFSYF